MTTHRVEIVNSRAARAGVPWREWSAAPFAEARASRRPVLLFLSASWSPGCAAMDRLVFADPRIVALVRSGWVAVRVDVDRRPDISDRYGLGGWPTTALLTPDGELLFGGTFLDADELAAALDRSRAAFDAGAAARCGVVRSERPSAPSVESPPTIDSEASDWLVEHLLAEADPVHGGFGRGVKYPVPDALALLLARYRASGDSSVGEVLTRSLDAICERLYDARDGGFFRYAEHRDWSGARREKRLADNAALVPVCLDAANLLDRPLYQARALETMEWARLTMSDAGHDGFFASVCADEAPRIDRTLFADANALMAASLVTAGDALGDTGLLDLGIVSLERVLLALYRPGAGVAHYFSDGPQVRGLLVDQVRAASALVDAARLTGRVPYVMLAEELMQYARRVLWDEPDGGFFDRPAPVPGQGDIGYLAERTRPFEANCAAARTLAALAALSERSEYREWAEQALASQTSTYRSYGVQGAAYGLAAIELRPGVGAPG